MIEDERDERRIAKRIGHIVRLVVRVSQAPAARLVDQPERADLPRDAVFEDGQLRRCMSRTGCPRRSRTTTSRTTAVVPDRS